MLRFILLGLALLAVLALMWWSAGLPDKGPGAAAARRARERGGRGPQD